MKKYQMFFILIYPALIIPLCIVSMITKFWELVVLANGILIGQIIRNIELIYENNRSNNDI